MRVGGIEGTQASQTQSYSSVVLNDTEKSREGKGLV